MSLEKKAGEILQNLTFEEKIGQMIIAGFRGADVKDNPEILKMLSDIKPGGVWITDNDSPMGHTIGNIVSYQQTQKLISDLQENSGIPLFVSIDAEGGKVIRLKEKYGFPATFSAKYLGGVNDPAFTYNESAKTADLLNQLGFNLNFAPVVDLELNPDNPPLAKKERCYSSDPEIVTTHACELIKASRDNNIITVLKHFPGHGSSGDDSHDDMVDVSRTWSDIELIPYKKLIDEGMADMILTAHVMVKSIDSEYPGTLSEKILTGLLRKQLGFNGVIISDDLNMGAVKKNFDYGKTIGLAINAGVDILLQGNVMDYSPDIIYDTVRLLREAVENNIITMNRINESVKRIILLKLKSGLMK